MDSLQRSKEILSKKLQEAVAEVDFDAARNLLHEWSGFMETFNAIRAIPGAEPCSEMVAGMRVLSECTTSCLTDAVQQRQFPMVDLLLRHAADVNVVDEGGSTPVLAAAMSTDETMLKLLLRHSADVNMRINKAEVTALHHVVILGLYPSARFLLEYGADVSVADKMGCTPLHLAAFHNMLEVARLLLLYGADCNSAIETTESTCYSPMHIAVMKGNADMVRLFLEHGAEVGAVIATSDWTLLMKAAWLGHEEVVELLLEHGAVATARNKDDQTPLHLAVSMGHLGVVHVLQKHINLVDTVDETGFTPLHVAARCGNEEIIEELALEGGNLDQFDKHMRTPLQVAVENNHPHVLEALLQAGAAYNTRDHEGKTPLFTAALLGNQEIVEMLLEMDQVNQKLAIAQPKETSPDAALPAQICTTKTEPPTLNMDEFGLGGQTHPPNSIPSRIASELRDRLAISTSEVIQLNPEVKGEFSKASESHSTHLPLGRDPVCDERRQLFDKHPQRGTLLSDQLSATPHLQGPLKSAAQRDPATLEFATLGRDEILQATNNFREGNVVGRGGFAVVYAGVLHGMPVAVKRLKVRAVKDAVEMLNQEVEVLRSLRHKHVVRLYGWCPTEMSMVYELCEGGTLSNRLPSLTWQQRLRVLTEVADALSELHQRQPQAVVHRDVKSSNVLLDANLAAKLADMGLACQMPGRTRKEVTAATQAMYTRVVAGTKGHMDPEYVSTGWVGPASDVYSFGVMMMQVIKGVRKVNPGSFMCDLNALERYLDSGRLATKLDERAGEWPEELAVSLVQLMIQCCECRRRRRPGMGEQVLPELRRLHLLVQEASPDHPPHPRSSGGAGPMRSSSQKSLLARVLKGDVSSPSQTHSPPPEIDSFAAEARQMSKCHQQQQQAQAATFFKWTKLHQACWQGNTQEAIDLVEAGADVHAADKMGYTPLHWAAYSGSVKTVQKLLEYGADGSRTDKSRRTPLDVAAQENHVEVVQILVQFNVTIDNVTMDGLNALDTAALLGNKETVELLEQVRREKSNPSDPEVLSSPVHPGSPRNDDFLQGGGAPGLSCEGADHLAAMEGIAHRYEPQADSSEAIAPFSFLAFRSDDILQATDNFDPDLILCEGTFSTTFKGSIQQHPVVIKVFDQANETDQVDTVRMMHREAEALRGILHNHVVRIYGWCPEEMALVYEPWVGGTLLEHMNQLHWTDRVRVAHEVAQGLNALHQRRPQAVVHRDLQPGVVLCGSTSTTKLSEFGLSTLMPEQPRSQPMSSWSFKQGSAHRDWEVRSQVKVHDEELVGTLGYMDPEYVATGWVSPSSDIYSLGVVMLEMLVGAVQNLTIASVTHRLNKLEEAMESNLVHEITDKTAGEWPAEHAHRFAKLVISCCEARQRQRPNLEQEVIPMLAELQASA